MKGYGQTRYGIIGYGLGESDDITPPIVTITAITRTKVSAQIGFDSSTITWYSNEAGDYQVEVGGTGKGFGYFIESGTVMSGSAMESVITDNELEDSDPALSDGLYRINIYVTDASNNTTPFEN